MTDQVMPCISDSAHARTLHVVRPDGLDSFASRLTSAQAAYMVGAGFTGRAQELLLLPGESGVAAAVIGIGHDRTHLAFGDLAHRLPEGAWRLAGEDFDEGRAVLGFCLGAYRYTAFKSPRRAPATLVIGPGHEAALAQAESIWMGRDLVNAPANVLGPTQLADAAEALAAAFGAAFTRTEGAALTASYPTIAAVGFGSERPPVVARLNWRGSAAADDAPLLALCGKGVVFDTGGYDMKSPAGMLLMKKDMGGAASVLTLARIIMQADLPLRLTVRLGCVENSVSGHAMRPSDVIRTRRGLSVEIGNTDAEGRLVLCDLLAEASDEAPALLVNCATLTGAARVALGPDLPALFCNDDGWATALLEAGVAEADPMWRLPLHDGYDTWLDSPVADLNNVSGKAHAGAVIAALFMRRFVAPGTPWAHLDTYCWNDSNRPARPEGGEMPAMRAFARAIAAKLVPSPTTPAHGARASD
jgi:leucyl aminopeptidase